MENYIDHGNMLGGHSVGKMIAYFRNLDVTSIQNSNACALMKTEIITLKD